MSFFLSGGGWATPIDWTWTLFFFFGVCNFSIIQSWYYIAWNEWSVPNGITQTQFHMFVFSLSSIHPHAPCNEPRYKYYYNLCTKANKWQDLDNSIQLKRKKEFEKYNFKTHEEWQPRLWKKGFRARSCICLVSFTPECCVGWAEWCMAGFLHRSHCSFFHKRFWKTALHCS